MLSRLALAALLVIGLSVPLQAQNMRRGQQGWQGAMAQPPTDIDGTVQGVMPGRIMVLDKNNQSWQVVVPAAAKVQVTGGATADYLQNRMTVEFKAEIDDQRTIKDKVEELKVVTLSPGRKRDCSLPRVKPTTRAASRREATRRPRGKKPPNVPQHRPAKAPPKRAASPPAPIASSAV